MMTPEKKALKKATRKQKNRKAKEAKAVARQANLALVGKLVYEKEVTDDAGKKSTVLCLPPAIRTAQDGSILGLKEIDTYGVPARVAGYGSTSLLFLSGRQHAQHGAQNKSRPGNKGLHAEANLLEFARRALTSVPPGPSVEDVQAASELAL